MATRYSTFVSDRVDSMASKTSSLRNISLISLFGVTAFVALLWCAIHYWPLRTPVVCVALGLFSSFDLLSNNRDESTRKGGISKFVLGLKDLIAGAAATCLLVGPMTAAVYLTNLIAITDCIFVLQLSSCLGGIITWTFPMTAAAVRKVFAFVSSFNFPTP